MSLPSDSTRPGDIYAIEKASIWHLLGQTIFSALAFLWAVVIARSLGVEGKGEVSAVLLCSALLASLGVLGTREGLAYFVGRDGVAIVPAMLRVCFMQASAVSAGAALMATGAQVLGTAALQGVSTSTIVVAGAAAGAIVLGSQCQAIMIAIGDVRGAALGPIIQIGTALMLVLLAINNSSESVATAILGYVGGLVCATTFCLLRLAVRIRRIDQRSSLGLKEYWQYCGKAIPASLAQFLNNRLDQAIIAASVGAGGLGAYSAAVNVSEVAAYPSASVSAIALPSVAGSGDRSSVVRRVFLVGTAVGVLAATALWPIGPLILKHLFGPGFEASIPVFRILLIAAFAGGIARLASSLSAGRGHPEVGSIASLCALAATIIGCVYAIPRFGIVGAAWVSLVAYGIAAGVGLWGVIAAESRYRTTRAQRTRDTAMVLHLYDDGNAGDAGITEGLCEMLTEAKIRNVAGWSTLSGNPDALRKRLHLSEGRFKCVHATMWAGLGDLWNGRSLGSRLANSVLFLLQTARGCLCIAFPRLVRLPIWTGSESRTLIACATADVIISKGGGFIYCERLRQLPFLMRMCLPLSIAGALEKRILLLGQTIGPLNGWLPRLIVRWVFVGAKVHIFARESRTVALLKEMGIPDAAIERAPDSAFRLQPRHDEERSVVRSKKAIISVRPWDFPGHPNPRLANAKYMQSVAAAAEYLIGAGYQLSLAAQVVGDDPSEDDRGPCRELLAMLPRSEKVDIVYGPKSPRAWIAVYQSAEIMIATRAHAMVFALCAQTPVIAISYNPKGTGIMEDCGLGDWCVEISDVRADALIGRVRALLERREIVAVKVRTAARMAWDRLEEVTRRLSDREGAYLRAEGTARACSMN